MGARIALASSNPGKVEEFRRLLDGRVESLLPLSLDVEESGDTYAENAELKARAALSASGLASLGDDSGIEVEALGGYPGVRSARVASTDAERIEVVWERLRRSGHQQPWKARFVCALALALPDGGVKVFEGAVQGTISTERRGEDGFGYDPIFVPEGFERTLAELGQAVKDRISHRARAVGALIASGELERISGR